MFSTPDYFPLPAGGTWTYRLTPGNETVSTRVVGNRSVNGANTTLLDDGTGNLQANTNDANGLRLHLIEVDAPSATVTFSPPIRWANAVANIGDRLESNRNASFRVPGAGTFPLNYSSTSRILAEERITVLYGTFQTVRVVFSFRLTGMINGDTAIFGAQKYIALNTPVSVSHMMMVSGTPTFTNSLKL